MDKKFLEKLAKSGRWEKIDTSSIPAQVVNRINYGEGFNLTTLIGYAAHEKKLDKLPKEFFNLEGLSKANGIKETALHFAAMGKQINYIPKEFLNKENLCAKNRDGTSPIHYAALHLCLDQIPKKYLTPEALSKVNFHGFGALEFSLFASMEFNIDPLNPLNPLDPKDNIPKTKDNKELSKKLHDQLNFILSKLDSPTLKEYLDTPVTSYIRECRTKLLQKEMHNRLIDKAFKQNANTLEI